MILEMLQTPAKARKVAGSKCSPQIPLTQWSDWHLPHHCPMPWVPAAASLVEVAKLSQEERYGLSRGCRSQHESAGGIQSHKANFGSIEVSNHFVIGVYFCLFLSRKRFLLLELRYQWFQSWANHHRLIHINFCQRVKHGEWEIPNCRNKRPQAARF